MRNLSYRVLNVFTVPGDRLSGNPLAVFEDGSSLSEAEMRALARQLNLSETTFLLPATRDGATARVRIFTPTFEMPFAGHPTLGTAFVARDLFQVPGRVVLEMKAGLVEVDPSGDAWTLRAAKAPDGRAPSASRSELAAMVGLPSEAVAGEPLWVDTGAEQLVIPLRSAADVIAARPNAELLAKHGFSDPRGESMAYVWARTDESSVLARFFFLVNGGVVEDPATGSACANLGGYLVRTGALGSGPIHLSVSQGEAISRPSRLGLRVDGPAGIFVTGEVVELGRGQFHL
jgi:trans-2,3-dihydro-3-hydroxyanthranilate isomerase